MKPVLDAEPSVSEKKGAQIERILCPIDFSQSSVRAYDYAQSLAGHYRATLVALHIVDLARHPAGYYAPSAPLVYDFKETLIANGQRDLQVLVKAPSGIRPECIVQEGSPADAILSLARERAISLIVLGTHGRRGLDRLMLGSVTERVLRNATCPVFTVCQTAPDSSTPDAVDHSVAIRRILCCIDFSAHSQRALEYALSLAGAYDAELTLLHVLDDVYSADVGKEIDATMEKLPKLLPPAARKSPKRHLEVRLGKAYQEILKFAAEAQSDLIVAGMHGRQALDLAVFGSTIYRVIQLSPGPVLAVPV